MLIEIYEVGCVLGMMMYIIDMIYSRGFYGVYRKNVGKVGLIPTMNYGGLEYEYRYRMIWVMILHVMGIIISILLSWVWVFSYLVVVIERRDMIRAMPKEERGNRYRLLNEDLSREDVLLILGDIERFR